AVVIAADDAEHALALANDTPYGLGAAIWTQTERGVEMARRIEAGQVSVNGIVKSDPRLPSGGIKRSGYGREPGPHGIREFTNAQQSWVGPATGWPRAGRDPAPPVISGGAAPRAGAGRSPGPGAPRPPPPDRGHERAGRCARPPRRPGGPDGGSSAASR